MNDLIFLIGVIYLLVLIYISRKFYMKVNKVVFKKIKIIHILNVICLIIWVPILILLGSTLIRGVINGIN